MVCWGASSSAAGWGRLTRGVQLDGRSTVQGAGAEDEVPVVGHDAVGEEVDGGAGVGLGEGELEGGVVLVVAEEGDAGDGAVEDVVDVAGGALAAGAGHCRSLAVFTIKTQKK